MSVIIRLQNLPWSANALDIRQYFRGLSIPEGGVHIVGGELGDAFIAFSTDEDARQAFNMNGGKIKEVQIKLLLSSRTEMQKVIEAARNQSAFLQVAAPPPQPLTISASAVVQKPMAPGNNDVGQNKANESKADPTKSSDKKVRRSRSRSRERRRDRSRDRSRDRKDRRRRDRSRSRERRDRNRDRRDRSRSRNRSRTKDRSRSRERDASRRGGKDKRKDTDKSSRSQSPTTIDLTVEPANNNAMNADTNSWDSNSHTGINFNVAGINNLGGIPPLDLMRKSIPGLMSTPASDPLKFMNAGGRNDLNFRGRESWPPANNQDRNNFREAAGNQSGGGNFRNDSVERNFMSAAGSNFGRNMNTFNEQRSPLFGNALNMLNQPRPFLNRPGSMQNSPFSPTLDNNSGSESGKHSDRGNDNYPRDAKQKITPKPGCCVKVRIGRGGYGEVRRFFQGLFIANDGIKLINDDDGVRTGIAYVRFVRSDGKADALQRNGHLNRGCPVEVLHLDDNEFDEAIDSYRPPYSKDRDSSNDREIERRPPKSQTPFNDKKNEKYSCMSISNLPPYTKEHDIITMIGDYPLVSIMMVMGRENRQLAYVQFNRYEDAYKVYSMEEKHEIHGKSVTVRLVSEDVFLEAKRQHNTGNGIVDVPDDFVSPSRSNKPSSPGNCFPRDNIVSNCVVLKGLPYKTSDRDIIDFFSDIGLVPTRIHVPLEKFNRQRSDSFCEFATPEEAVRALAKNGVPLGMSEVTVELVPRREMEQILGVPPQGAEPPGRFPPGPRFGGTIGTGGPNPTRHLPSLLGPGPRGMPPGGPLPNTDIPEAFRKPGCVISLENVPFRAGVDEILDFFHEFDIPEANVLRRYNDKGNPTGDARVAFNSPAEAMRAVNKLRHCKIRDRTIFMYMT